MLYVSVEAVVRRRSEIVWDVLTDIAGLPTWIEGLVEASRLPTADGEPAEPLGAGGQLIIARRHGRQSAIAKAVAEITVWRPPSLLVIETRAADLLLLDRVALEPSSEGTIVRFSAEIIYGNKLIEVLARPRGILLGNHGPHPVDEIYERSALAFVKRVESIAVAPYR